MEDLQRLRDAYSRGILTEAEYNTRRVGIIDRLTGTTAPPRANGPPPAAAPPQATPLATYAGVAATAPRPGERTHVEFIQTPGSPIPVTVRTYQAAPPPAMKIIAPTGNAGQIQPVLQPSAAGAGPSIHGVNDILVDESYKRHKYQMLQAAMVNDVTTMEMLVNDGIDINVRDWDSGNTPLIMAATKGQKHAIYWLTEHGADLDAKNHLGETALHALMHNRYTHLALWMIKAGANPHVTNNRGFAAFDNALPWQQDAIKELIKEQKESSGADKRKAALLSVSASGSGDAVNEVAEPEKPKELKQEVMKIYLKNGAYKSIVVYENTTARDLCNLMADKLQLTRYSGYLETIESKNGVETRLDPNTPLWGLKSRWPMVLREGRSAVGDTHRFVVLTKRGTDEAVTNLYRNAIYGNES